MAWLGRDLKYHLVPGSLLLPPQLLPFHGERPGSRAGVRTWSWGGSHSPEGPRVIGSQCTAGRSGKGASYGEKEEPSREFSHFASNNSPTWLLLCCNQPERGSHVSSSIPKVSCMLPYSFPSFFILVCAQGDLEGKIFGDLGFWPACKYQLLLLGGDPIPGACACTH